MSNGAKLRFSASTGKHSPAAAASFRSVAEAAREECPVSRALAGNLEVHLDAELVG